MRVTKEVQRLHPTKITKYKPFSFIDFGELWLGPVRIRDNQWCTYYKIY